MNKETFIELHGADAYFDLVYPREKHFFPVSARLEAPSIIHERISELSSNIGMDDPELGLEEMEKEFKKGKVFQPGLWETLLADHKLLPVDHEDQDSPGFADFFQDIKDAWERETNPMLSGGIIYEITR